ncbi:senescence-specific cysteine protease SAG12-like [Syzygium oleosum]|uniref:senescence-specific cysteine protease SAG12-like n=1 Tax=Syzygium oleosum TaxID=219896 RepID=UPI0011D1F640|nr:senescence-specific cysteine protease SAG12-like [Syzygium oleosum]
MQERHEQWMAHHGQVYKDAAEKERRFVIFKNNVEFIESFNKAADKPYKLGINGFTDLTNKEFQPFGNGYKRLSSPKPSSTAKPFRYGNVSAVPSSMDWRKKGAVTPVKDQGQCAGDTCNAPKEASHAATISRYEDIPPNCESALRKAVAPQPVSVTIDAGEPAFKFFSSRAFTEDCRTNLDHVVTMVWYGMSETGIKY